MTLTEAGLLKTTLLDFPGEVASVIFTPGCNLRCPYCHNPGLVDPLRFSADLLPIEEIKSFLSKRAHLIGGVVITGGEPLLHDDLVNAIDFIHSLNLKVKIDTNGLFPDRLKQLNADYIAMDLKTSPEHYYRLGLQGNKDKLKDSIEFITGAGIPHEFRTTVTEEIVTIDDMEKMALLLKDAEQWFLTPFKPGETLDPAYSHKIPPSSSYMEKLLSIALEAGINSSIR
ncbi:anaerobic ribonucleoside-triphosphate reductase activating protein [Spirochaeta isovalerica]|uniref:Pyruvate formate lyase activating enzyme n=1 Tax=Spirochaeta isovalerica TaxID=150 RepID=A0A841R9B7_9SPIO|nr:anaerobic ribonucleoside-triphosphate reductase activating protein [Spirochaeta isovalerica]MBB6480376.1 pyruvate formate lyase activating enzyme [Spirochaeta isovalerica]